MENKNYYVYALLDPRKKQQSVFQYEDFVFFFEFEPFYIGFGSKDRVEIHWKSLNRKKLPVTKKNSKLLSLKEKGVKPIEMILAKDLTSDKAKTLECALIAGIGRSDQEKGPLTNGTDGGDGAPNLNEESRSKIAWNKGMKFTEKEKREKWPFLYDQNSSYIKNAKMSRVKRLVKKYGLREGINREKEIRNAHSEKNWKWTEEDKKKQSERLRGIKKVPMSQETKDKLSIINSDGRNAGENNPMYGVNFRDLKKERFGEEEEARIEAERRALISSRMDEAKQKAKSLFPNLNGNASHRAVDFFMNHGMTHEDAEKASLQKEAELKEKSTLKKREADRKKFWDNYNNGDPEKVALVNEAKIILEYVSKKGDEGVLNHLNEVLGKKKARYTQSRIDFLNAKIKDLGITLETAN